MSADGLMLAQQKMRDAAVPAQAIEVFSHYFRELEAGVSGMIAEDDVDPLRGVARAGDIEVTSSQKREAAAATAVIKLNGGLGTSMGMGRAKSLLAVRPQLCFLDIIVQQVRSVRTTYDVALPLIFMNSFRTQADTRAALAAYPEVVAGDLPLDFLQNREPKLTADGLRPVEWAADPSLEWCPPGHGDLYTALEVSGVLDRLLSAGFRYACVSNADNLGAAPDPAMMAWFAGSGAPYAAEVCERTPADVKGGYLVVRKKDGRLVLRETAQTRAEDRAAARDIGRHAYFHTNNLWFDLAALRSGLRKSGGVLGLPLIRNIKTVDPADQASPEVIQIETAMGAAIEFFDGAQAIEVDRSRFLPVKTTNDLLVLRSDAYRVAEDFTLHAATDHVPIAALDRRFFTAIADFDRRIPQIPSMVGARSLHVDGDWHFGPDVVVCGDVVLRDSGEPQSVAASTRLGPG